MRLLLDTHIWIWSLLEPDHLTRRVRKALESAANELWLSPVSTWELLLLIQKGRVVVDREPARWVEEALQALPYREAALTHQVALESRVVELPHRDPVDRFLAASARVHGLTLVTADSRLLESRTFATLPNR